MLSAYFALAWLNFFIADVRDGLGPYLGVFLKEHQFTESQIGLITTSTSLCALIFGIFLGVLIDKTHFKRGIIALCIVGIVLATGANYFYPHFTFTLMAQIAIALCAVCLAPAFSAITLGIVGQSGYSRQVSLNEAYKHAGTAFSAGLSFIFALYYGIGAIFIITALMGVCALVFLALLKSSQINHAVACGKEEGVEIPLRKALGDVRVLFLGLVMFCFHLSNAYMLPLLSQRAHTLGVDSSGAYAAATILIAQCTMIGISLLCMRLLQTKGNPHFSSIYVYLMGIALFGLIVRGGVAAHFDGILAMIIVQILDGVGAGIVGVILPLLVAMLMRGSGHINAAFACVMTFGGVGAALSGSLGGYIAQYFGYFYAYLTLAFVAAFGLSIWVFSYKIFRR
ncbi:MFS transporter [Campylobacter upsaliensis]|uniref:MFS transporter n=1 Tax=Campylobacter upsaliensis TaxID=28080 RepID=UPI001BD9DFB5|nr:MFS transporter [Campylobacter upsaliensis]EHZ0304413.1 MFS transporter [Campylobacter upsaliensis]EID3271052.1 MFS transporter [Campylobacter upsaliensis]EIE1464685.1 MFS transporter [Campylobacter upsaliensis]EIJ6626464.1 MFS transporter [Campylobacter upsaliensis]EIL6893745.1 MFS transporter [Campylobacter upsaliensis]